MALRRSLALALTGLVAAGTLTACSSAPPARPRAKVEHTTNATPAQQADAAGPPARALRPNWRIEVPGATKIDGDVGLELMAGQVVLSSARGITAYDGRNGAERWHYREPGRTMTGYAATGQEETAGAPASPVIVAFTEQRGGPRRTIALDAATGRLLWNASPTWRPLINPKNRKAVAGAGVILAVDQTPEGATMLGIDARTGQVKWTQRRLQYCAPDSLQGITDSDGSIFVMPEGCFYTVSEVHAFDPATGAVKWRRRPPPDFTDAMIRNGVALLNSRSLRRSSSALVTSSGKRLRTAPPPCSYGIGCHFTSEGNRLFLSTAKGGGRPQVTSIDVRSRKAKTITLPGGSAEDHLVLSSAGGRVYGMRKRLAGKLLPAELDLIDPATMGVRRVAMPFAFQANGIGEYWGIGRVEAADGLLYVLGDLGGKIRLTAYAPSGDRGPAELGGTRVKDWPDACKLFSGLRRVKPGKVDNLGVGGVQLPSWGCKFNWTARLKTGVVVIGWVAPDEKQATDMMVVDPAQAHLLANVADQAYTFTNNDQGGPDLVMRLGRHIVVSYGIREQEQEDLVALARTVVKNLQRQP